MQIIIGIFLAIICSITYAAPINWTIATTSFPSDQSMGDTGQEKVPNGHIDLMSGQIVFDIPEVTLKGHRGLDFTLSRSYGKVNNGFRSIANWELEVPRLVMMTGASTKLQGDYNGQGICQSNGDYSNGNSSAGSPIYQTSILDSGYKNEVIPSYLELTNANYLKSLAYALQYASSDRSTLNSSDYFYNKLQSQSIYNGINPTYYYTAKVSTDIQTFTNDLVAKNKNNINALTAHLTSSYFTYSLYISGKDIRRIDILYSGNYLGKTKSIYVDTADFYGFTKKVLIPSFNYEVLGEPNVKVRFYNSAGQEVILRDYNNQLVDIMPLVYTNAYANTVLSLLQLKWDGQLSKSPSNELWSFNKPTTSTSDFYLYSNVDTRQRPISLYLPGQKNIIFYPIQNGVTGYPASTRYISQDNWIISCENGGNNFRVRAPNGVNYLFPIENRENQTGFPTIFSSQYIAGRVSLYASKVENQFGESYSMNYSRIENTNPTYQGYNNSSKLFLENVRHQLDGRDVLSTPELALSYAKYKDGSVISENKDEFSSINGDIILSNIKRYINGRYVVWKAYTYYTGDKSNYLNNDPIPGSTNTVAQVQNKQAASVYLRTVGDVSGDAIAYEYGGPYRIIGNHPKSINGITSQGYMWFYSDLMGAKFFKASSNGLINVKSVNWSYSLINAPRPGFDEAQSFKITYSNYTGVNANSLQINYGYSRNKESNELTTTVTTKDLVTGLSKAYTYVMNAFDGGVAESFLHGLLKKVTIGDRQENYSWTTLSLIGQNPATANDNYTGYNYVYLVRPSSKTINHFGEYKTTYSNFDQYGNAQTIQQTGLNGGSAIQLPSTTTTYFNANAGNDAVNNGSLPWIIGLPKQKTSGNFTVQTTEYDELGAIQSQTQAGRITKYKYETLSFSTCLGNLVDFQWSTFVGCFSNYVSGDRHTGLPIEVDVGNGKQITQFAAYQNGIPTQIKLANGGQESNVVDDFGHIVRHTDADGVRSENQYDDAGRLIVETPIAGLSYTTISYDGLNILKTAQNGGNYSKAEKYNGDGLLIHSAENTTDKTVVMTNSYDAFGNITFSSNPSSNGTTTGISTDYDVFDRPKTVNDNGVTINYCYQSCAGRSGAIALVSDAYGVTESNYLSAGDFSPELKTSVSRKGNDGSVFETFTDYDLALLQPIAATSGASIQRYTYNSNGTLATEKDNSINGQKTYGYDATGKINTITHQDGSVETIEYYPINDLITSRNWRGVTTSYGYTAAGRLTSTSNANTAQSYGRDNLGRVISLTQSINSHDANYAFTLTFGYNNLNQIISINYPNGKAVDLSNQNAFGEIGSIPNVIQSLNYNALHQLIFVQANSDVAWDYSYSNNGLPTGVSSTSLNKCAVSISYGYDALNRINRMVDNCGATYNASIDRYGTGLMKQVEQDHARYQYSYNNDDISTVNVIAKSQFVAPASYVYQYVNGTSRLGSVSGSPYQFSYDGMGNVTNDGIRALDYDAYYRISKNGNESYIYNADGLRVRAVRENGITDYIYDLAGHLIYEINHRAGYSQAYVYVGDKLVATLEHYPDANDGYDFINNFEAAEFGLLNLLDSYLDSDDDGLPDYLERFIGSDPNNPDTDGDGYKDGYEYKQLGAKGVLEAGIHPSEPDPDEEMMAWLPTVLDLILEDD
ncbi:RHS repeat protein [Acinetobacter sp. UC24323]|uniref:RHS repeat protein n=1 Tax=Acinetobacter TaxID=469 RepID=UPI00209D393F|nr:RHS repeat protein [Acinetobacter sp. UC24323]MCO9050794.1 RHS repeat protein [Acinetobacter sp. UC24323]MDC4466239.1 RHS repeat protein [Acinetobacter baumannii]